MVVTSIVSDTDIEALVIEEATYGAMYFTNFTHW